MRLRVVAGCVWPGQVAYRHTTRCSQNSRDNGYSVKLESDSE